VNSIPIAKVPEKTFTLMKKVEKKEIVMSWERLFI
jgi:hypothetical protein